MEGGGLRGGGGRGCVKKREVGSHGSIGVCGEGNFGFNIAGGNLPGVGGSRKLEIFHFWSCFS